MSGDGAKVIKKTADLINATFILDKFHGVKEIYQGILVKNRNKLSSEQFFMAYKLFVSGEYEQLITYLKSFNIKRLKIRYFMNNKTGIINQGNKNNIGCFAESNVFHLIKSMLGNGAKIYNLSTFKKMVTKKCQSLI